MVFTIYGDNDDDDNGGHLQYTKSNVNGFTHMILCLWSTWINPSMWIWHTLYIGGNENEHFADDTVFRIPYRDPKQGTWVLVIDLQEHYPRLGM